MSEQTYLIHELAEKTGVSLRTIRFYIEKGLLSEPPIKGRYAAYSEEYVERIKLILGLKQLRYSLDQIGEFMESLNRQQVIEELQKLEAIQRKAKKSRGNDQQGSLPGLKEVELLKAVESFLNGEDYAPLEKSPRRKKIFNGDIWERVVIAKGIELHFRQPVDARHLRKIQNIIDFARHKMREDEEKE